MLGNNTEVFEQYPEGMWLERRSEKSMRTRRHKEQRMIEEMENGYEEENCDFTDNCGIGGHHINRMQLEC